MNSPAHGRAPFQAHDKCAACCRTGATYALCSRGGGLTSPLRLLSSSQRSKRARRSGTAPARRTVCGLTAATVLSRQGASDRAGRRGPNTYFALFASLWYKQGTMEERKMKQPEKRKTSGAPLANPDLSLHEHVGRCPASRGRTPATSRRCADPARRGRRSMQRSAPRTAQACAMPG